jgi:redox-sensitive bicupin YhaK (pirin superfamily)
MMAQQIQYSSREVVHRNRGFARGPITRLVSPSDLGEVIKPFVFLDLATFEGDDRIPIARLWHPHSGIATVTVMLEGAVRIADTTGTDLELPKGGIEWMRAGNGVWHTGQAEPGHVKAFQLWIALPPDLENGPSSSHYVMPDDVPTDGPVRVILGTYSGMTSPINVPPMLTYLVVSLEDGDRWTYTPPKGHDVAWVAVSDGDLRTARSAIPSGEVAIFAEGSEPIEFIADGPTRFVLGSARKHPHDLVLGYYSVHTSEEALRQGEAEIRRIGNELRANGTLRSL